MYFCVLFICAVDVEKPLHIAGGNLLLKWCSHFGNQFGSSSKKEIQISTKYRSNRCTPIWMLERTVTIWPHNIAQLCTMFIIGNSQ